MQPKSSTFDIGFEELSLELPSGTRVLKGVTGKFEAGRMCAIMGPSGAGKTTFMNVLTGKATYGKMGGTVTVNGEEIEMASMGSVIGFVPQDDIVHEDLTVREQIEFSSKLRNKPNSSERRVAAITDDVLNVMQISHIQNTLVGGVEQRGISGGQRKRVNIGLELAAQPTVLFLDEPTSGLDATSSLAVALSLKKMCQLGTTSIMVIHQPRYSLFTLFDDVLLLGKGGQTVYLGSSLDAKPYFESLGFEMPPNENPADWFMDIISGEVPNPRIPDFKPEMLFDIWVNRKGSITNMQPGIGQSRSRVINEQDDQIVLMRRLEEEWDVIDQNRDGVLQENELHQLLVSCSRSSEAPDDQVVRDLMMRMAGEDATVVTKEEFVNYLSSLSGIVAKDRLLAKLDQGHKLSEASGTDEVDNEGIEGDNCDTSACSDIDVESGKWSNSADCDLRRASPGFHLQLQIIINRRIIQWWRKNRQRALFMCPLSGGAIVLAIMDRFLLTTARWDAGSFLYIHSALSLLISIFCLQVFANDRPVFWRECSKGLNVEAFYLSRTWVNIFDLAIQAFVFTALYYLIRQPGVPFWLYLTPFLLVTFAASGWGYLISTLVPPKHGPFISALVVFIVCAVLGDPEHMNDFLDGGIFEAVVSTLSITRWSVAMNVDFQVDYAHPHPDAMVDQRKLALQDEILHRGMLSIGYWWTATLALLMQGFALRIFASLGLRFTNRDKKV